MSSTYWQKVAIERVYLRCCQDYLVARVGDGKLMELGRFARDFREQVERAAEGLRDVPRSVLARACEAFLGDEHAAEVRHLAQQE